MPNVCSDTFNLNDIELIVFDKDGTLFDVHHYWKSMIELRAATLVKELESESTDLRERLIDGMGVDLSTGKLKLEGPVGVKKRSFIANVVYELIKESGHSMEEEQVESLFKKVDSESTEIIDQMINFLPGVESLLKACVEKNVKLAIATTDKTDRANLALRSKKLDHLFHFVAGADLVENAKPDPEIMDLILGKLAVDPKKTVMVGDHAVDLQLAINSNIAGGIGVATGLYDMMKLSEHSNFCVEDLTRIYLQ